MVEQQTDHREERHRAGSDTPTDKNKKTDNTNRKNRYSLRNKDSIKQPSRYEALRYLTNRDISKK